MNSRKTEFWVGIFILLAVLAALMLALSVANRGMEGSSETYRLYAKFDNIGGLKPRSSVKLGGVVIGRVERIYLDREDFSPVVEMAISSDYTSFPETSSVSILTSGLLGEQYVGFIPGFSFEGIEPLQDGDYLQDTRSALVLEDLIGQFLFNRGSGSE